MLSLETIFLVKRKGGRGRGVVCQIQSSVYVIGCMSVSFLYLFCVSISSNKIYRKSHLTIILGLQRMLWFDSYRSVDQRDKARAWCTCC